jgi:hypothetical protein
MHSLMTLHLARSLVDEHQRKAALLCHRKTLAPDHVKRHARTERAAAIASSPANS